MREPDFAAMVERRDGLALSRALSDLHPADIAALIGQLPSGESEFVFSRLPDPGAAEVLDELEPATRQSILSEAPRRGSEALSTIWRSTTRPSW